MSSTVSPGHRVATRDEWMKERLVLLNAEKELMRRRDALAARVRELPWVRVDKSYEFETASGRRTLPDLFGSRNQLVVYHFMFDPTWSQGCMGCSFVADHFNGIVVHLAQRDISLVAASKAPMEKIGPFRSRMGWTFPWVSYGDGSFGRDFGVSFTDEELAGDGAVYNFNRKPMAIRELPGLSVFVRHPSEPGTIFHTYSTYARGLEDFLTAYRYIDITPGGRGEAPGEGMSWLRHHDRYGDAVFVPPWMEKPGVTAPPAR